MTRALLLLAALLPTLAGAQVHALVCVLGDSTTLGLPWTAGRVAWPQRLQQARQFQRFALINNGVGGLRCDEIETQTLPAFVASAKSRGCTRVVVQCGLNDLLQNRTAAQIYGTGSAPGPYLRIVNAVTGAGIPATVLTASPLGGSYNYPSGVQAEHMDLNARIRAKSGMANPSLVTVVDVYRALGQTGPIATALATDPGNGVTMPGTYNFGDGLHYTSGNGVVIDATTGDGRVAEALNATPGALP